MQANSEFDMIFGTGIDIVNIERIEHVMSRWGDLFLDRVFTEKEIFWCQRRARPSECFAVFFAAKEAFLKAIGTGIIPQLAKIEVHNPVNFIERDSIDDFKDVSISGQHYIYSKKVHNYYVSIALPGEAKISLYNVNEKNFNTYFE